MILNIGMIVVRVLSGKALEMYQKYWHWEDALILAQNRAWTGLDELKNKHLSWLLDSGQAARAAAIIENDNPRKAVKLYLEARRPGRAARLILTNEELLDDNYIVNDVIKVLKNTDLMELAGEVSEKISNPEDAIKCYAKAGVFARALELARRVDPTSVVDLERDWAQHLTLNGHYDAAINHYIEAGETGLALNAAVMARQWRKALQIIQVNSLDDLRLYIINIWIQVIEDDSPEIQQQCLKLAEYYDTAGDRNLAESLFIRAGDAGRAIDVHVKAGDWSRAHQIASEYLDNEQANQVLEKHANSLEETGDLRQAESLYVAIGQYDSAIAMHRKSGHRSDMVRLVAKYRPDLLQTTHAHLARELDAAGKSREAEQHFLAAGDWRGAVTSYKSANMWEDALRVAKRASGDKAAQQVIKSIEFSLKRLMI